MYYSNIANSEVKEFHKTVKVNVRFDELDYEDIVRSQANKFIPLFYCDEIIVGENLEVLDNQIILYSTYSSGEIHFVSKNQIKNINIVIDELTVGSKDFVHLHFYNPESFNSVVFLDFQAEFKDSNNEIILTVKSQVDRYGNYVFEKPRGAESITIIANNQTFNKELI